MKSHQRRSIRVPDFDYSNPGPYFITVVTANRAMQFGSITNGEMHLNDAGQMVQREWRRLPVRFSGLEIEEYVIMPNHFHGLLMLNGGQDIQKYEREAAPGSVGVIVRAFKASTTLRFRHIDGWDGGPLWQRNYYEHVVRGDHDYNRIREYILNNPAQWEADREYLPDARL